MTLKDKLTKPLYQYSFDGDSYHSYIRFEDMDKIIEEQLKVVEECVKQKHKEVVMSFLDFAKEPTTFPATYKFLEDRFTWDNVEEIFKSKNKWRGLSSGDDKTLYIYADEWCTNIWWKENRGSEDVIFDGRELKTEEEFNQVFELLGLKTLLKWE